jgi:internalin A
MVASEAEGRAEALRRIAACRIAQAEELDLGGLRLTALDGELLAALCQLRWLRRLFLGLSAEARENPQLRLKFRSFINDEENSKLCNTLSALPGALFDALTRLERLDLALNRLRRLPASIANLTACTSLDLAGNDIAAEGAQALRGLVNLTRLNLLDNRIGAKGAQALKGLVNLTSLNLANNDIGAEGAQALRGLVNLTSLDLRSNRIGDISPLVSLRNLCEIDLSGSHLDHDAPAFWRLPSLKEVILHETSLPGVPVEILSEDSTDNCLDRLRAHLADLTGNDVSVSDVKLMILGNGRVGKTQICRRLRGESFDEAVPSTQGIQVSSLPLAPQVSHAPVTLKIWDFGGQDIYRGTHALFLTSRAVFPLVWTPKSEAEQFHTHGGFTFRNQPLAYWVAYVRTFGGAQSPVLVIQSQCDRPEDERDPPLSRGALDGFVYKKVLYYSAKGDGTHARGHAALKETLLDAVQWMRGTQGVAKIGPGRAAVKEALEVKLAAGQRLISHQRYLDLCAEVEHTRKGPVSDPALLLDYLHNIGTVFYREGLFGNQIILDQAWALDAVYAVFDRACFKKIERNRGRFRRSELAEWIWQKHGVPEQQLFLSFMQQCGICFTVQKEDHEKRVEAEYIAPDLLPTRSDDETQKRLKLVWDEASPDAEAVLTFALLPPGLMRDCADRQRRRPRRRVLARRRVFLR